MATYNFSTLANGAALTFNPLTDELVFDNTRYLANQIDVYQEGANVVFHFPGLTTTPALPAQRITLLNVTLEQLEGPRRSLTDPSRHSNVRFANGGYLTIGDDGVETTADVGTNGLVGTDQNDRLLGLGGNDTLSGRAGDDWLDGGTGNDTLLGDAGKDRLYGGDGADILDGGFDLDALFGGRGNDTYFIESASDLVVETDPTSVGGVDLVYSQASYTLTANVENLILGAATPGEKLHNYLNLTLFVKNSLRRIHQRVDFHIF